MEMFVLSAPSFATAKSKSPSRSKSPNVTDRGPNHKARFVARLKLPPPFPSRIDTLLEEKLETARSR